MSMRGVLMVIEGRHMTTSARDALPRACTLYTRALHQRLCYCVCSISSRAVLCEQSNLFEPKSLNGDVVSDQVKRKRKLRITSLLQEQSDGQWMASVTDRTLPGSERRYVVTSRRSHVARTRATSAEAEADLERLERHVPFRL